MVWDIFSGLFKFCLPLSIRCSPDTCQAGAHFLKWRGSSNFPRNPEIAAHAADNARKLIGSRAADNTKDETGVIRGRGDVRHSLVTKSSANEDELDRTLSGTVRAAAELTEP